jgi:hypothetical protein
MALIGREIGHLYPESTRQDREKKKVAGKREAKSGGRNG